MKRLVKGLSPDALDLVAARFRVLGEPMRLKLLQILAAGEMNVTGLILKTGATQANVSKHLSILLQHGMLYKRKEGVTIYYGISDDSVYRLCSIVCGGLQKQFRKQANDVST